MREPAPAAVLSFRTRPCSRSGGPVRARSGRSQERSPCRSSRRLRLPRCGRTGPAESRRGRRGQCSRVGPAGGLASLCAHEGCGPSVPPAAQPALNRRRVGQSASSYMPLTQPAGRPQKLRKATLHVAGGQRALAQETRDVGCACSFRIRVPSSAERSRHGSVLLILPRWDSVFRDVCKCIQCAAPFGTIFESSL